MEHFGPLYVKDHKQEKKKVWVCLFTCVVVRAIHLEIVADLTVEEFLMTLKRFIARRGKPNEIISDNVALFKLSKSMINITWDKILKGRTVQSYIAERGIRWKFIIELLPLMGDFCERLVGCSKMTLQKSIGNKYLTQLHLQTFLSEAEAVLNSRPLVYFGDDLNDGMTITSSYFLALNTKTGNTNRPRRRQRERPKL